MTERNIMLGIGLAIIVCMWTGLAAEASSTSQAVIAQARDDTAQALQLYRDVMSGRRGIDTLSPEELQMVLKIQRLLRRSAPSNAKPECRDAMDRAQSGANDIVQYSRRLISCVEGGDFRDDCYSEFRRVKSAHGDFESAVSEVKSYCD